jgi:hypothetical protein
MTRIIDAPGLAKVSTGDLRRETYNELQRVRRRLKRAKEKLVGLRALRKDLQRYLQPGDYELIETQLQREIERRTREHRELGRRYRDEQMRELLGEERFLKYYREGQELDEKVRKKFGRENHETD